VHAADQLIGILKNAARLAGAMVHVADGPNDVATPAGIHQPDIFIVPRDVARHRRKVCTYYSADPLLVAEAISRSGSEQVDRVRKVRQYARAEIPLCWRVDLEPPHRMSSPIRWLCSRAVTSAGA